MFFATYYESSIAALSGFANRKIFVPWQRIGQAVDDKTKILRNSDNQLRLKAAINFVACVCNAKDIDPATVCLEFNESQQSNARVIRDISQPDAPYVIQLKPRVILDSPEEIRRFVLAHELGHIINKDLEHDSLRASLASGKERSNNLTPLEQRDLAHAHHKIELAANATAVSLFPTVSEGIAAGQMALQARFADNIVGDPYRSAWIRKSIPEDSPEYRYHTHPSPQLCIRMLKRLAAAPK